MRFLRSELIFGDKAMKRLSQVRVAVFGLGGVGGFALEALARAGVGQIDIVDSDTVDITNINRQLIALTSTVGMKKTELFESRIKDINPLCRVSVHDMFYLPERAGEFEFDKFDYVVDAIDTVTAKIDLAVRCTDMGIPIISSMGTGNKTDPTALRVADIYETSVCPLARVMRCELRKRGVSSLKVVYSEEKPVEPDEDAVRKYRESNPDNKKTVPASTSFVPPVAGMIIASEVIRDILETKR